MESSVTSNLVKNGQTLADKAADKVQGGIRDAQHVAAQSGAALSSTVDELRSDAGPAMKRVVGRVQSMSRHGMDAVSDMASQVRDVASTTSDSIVAYTKKNPATALAIAAASGALIYAAIRAVRPSRD
jgi:ElaB/YqjD/DUF883 family membrane-anchored ribosome-binding protein